jgi:DnaJ-class molecular chaperone
MQREIGKATDCPQCKGAKVVNKRRCPTCDGEGRVEFQERDGTFMAPAGSWLPTKRKGQSGYRICLFGGPRQAVTR